MCGLTGFFAAAPRQDAQAIARAMNDAIRHRGPDGHGVWQSPDGRLVLAHRRLAIIDLSEEGAQPMTSASGRYVMTYNGEIYNYQAMKDELEAAGVKFRGRSDTEVFLAAVDQWGLNRSLQKASGMFAIALWDARERMLHLIRDRFGKKPLYVGWAGKSLVFGSELKALRAHPDFKARINPQALSLYMRYGFVPAPYSIYENTWSVPPGHRIALSVDALGGLQDLSPRMEPYWHFMRSLEESRLKARPRPEAQIIEEFEELLGECVKGRMISDVPLGAFLSGGIDSSAVVALMQQQSSQPVKTYTIGFDEAGFDEARHAANIAAHLGTDHHELYVDARAALDVVPRLPEMFDEPFADASAIPMCLVSQFARQDVTVALSGDGGDELLGGYNRHITAPRVWGASRWLPGFARRTGADMLSSLSQERWGKIAPGRAHLGNTARKVAAMLAHDSPEDVYYALLHQNDDDVLQRSPPAPMMLEDDSWQPRGLSMAEDFMARDAMFYLPSDVLTKVDRASMNVALEARAPLLDPRLHDFAWQLPLHYKIRGGQGKWLLRAMLRRHVPATMFERPKQGFNVPVGAWLRGPLKDWAQELLQPDEFLNSDKVSAVWQEHQEGRRNNEGSLWTILMFRAWQERWG